MNRKHKIVVSLAAALLLGGTSFTVPAWAAQTEQTAAVTSAKPAVQETKAAKVNPKKFAGYIWRIDAENESKLPRNFRTMNSDFHTNIDVDKTGKDFNPRPTRDGLATLNASGSAEFSEKEFEAMLPVLKSQAKGPIYIVDLRQESHGFFNGTAVSWYGRNDWGNIGKTHDMALADESKRLKEAKGHTVVMSELDKHKLPSEPTEVKVKSVVSEEELVKRHGLHYFRITATDHIWPSPDNIDAFVTFVKGLPQDAWLHFHCQAGQGRTTAYMAMYDMMKNPDVSFGDILSRQYLLGGNYVAYTGSSKKGSDWKNHYYQEKAQMIEKFYQYVQENHASGFDVPWSKWLRENA